MQQPWYFENLGKKADGFVNEVSNVVNQTIDKGKQTIDKGKQKVNEAKNAVREGVNSTIKALDNKANQAKSWMARQVNVLTNTYRSVSNSVKEGIKKGAEAIQTKFNKLIEGGSRAIDSGKEWAKDQIIALNQVVKQLDQAIKTGTLKGIKYAAETGTLIIYVGKEVIKASINRVNYEINTLKSAITAKAIQWIKFAKETGELVIQTGKKMIKVSTAAAISAGLVVYKEWKLMIDMAKTNINKITSGIHQQYVEVKHAIDQGIKDGRKWAAEYARNFADFIEPQSPSYLYAQEK